MEEEIKMLKEALATRNSELQSSRSIIAKMVGRLNNLETQVQTPNQQSSPKSTVEIRTEGSLSQNESNPPSLISISEDGLDDGGSSAKSWSTTLISDISQLQSDKRIANFKKSCQHKSYGTNG
ncbi:hypothetical protein L1049_024790 [Liquidambar formosana]|uniref:Uncharacterized protein n=1 Tax=Liquidambar formosana TaxID=63359 RepID=A0AAP0X5E1_LIQFO